MQNNTGEGIFKLYKCKDCNCYIFERTFDKESFLWMYIKKICADQTLPLNGVVCHSGVFNFEDISCKEAALLKVEIYIKEII